jgi:hypothetical protein
LISRIIAACGSDAEAEIEFHANCADESIFDGQAGVFGDASALNCVNRECPNDVVWTVPAGSSDFGLAGAQFAVDPGQSVISVSNDNWDSPGYYALPVDGQLIMSDFRTSRAQLLVGFVSGDAFRMGSTWYDSPHVAFGDPIDIDLDLLAGQFVVPGDAFQALWVEVTRRADDAHQYFDVTASALPDALFHFDTAVDSWTLDYDADVGEYSLSVHLEGPIFGSAKLSEPPCDGAAVESPSCTFVTDDLPYSDSFQFTCDGNDYAGPSVPIHREVELSATMTPEILQNVLDGVVGLSADYGAVHTEAVASATAGSWEVALDVAVQVVGTTAVRHCTMTGKPGEWTGDCDSLLVGNQTAETIDWSVLYLAGFTAPPFDIPFGSTVSIDITPECVGSGDATIDVTTEYGMTSASAPRVFQAASDASDLPASCPTLPDWDYEVVDSDNIDFVLPYIGDLYTCGGGSTAGCDFDGSGSALVPCYDARQGLAFVWDGSGAVDVVAPGDGWLVSLDYSGAGVGDSAPSAFVGLGFRSVDGCERLMISLNPGLMGCTGHTCDGEVLDQLDAVDGSSEIVAWVADWQAYFDGELNGEGKPVPPSPIAISAGDRIATLVPVFAPDLDPYVYVTADVPPPSGPGSGLICPSDAFSSYVGGTLDYLASQGQCDPLASPPVMFPQACIE